MAAAEILLAENLSWGETSLRFDILLNRFAKPAAESGVDAGDFGMRMTSFGVGMQAEQSACAALVADGWSILGRRLRTKAGEIDAVAEKDGLVAFVEVKARPTLAMAAGALGPRQQGRLVAAAEILLAENPSWGRAGLRFDVLLVDPQSRVRRISDAIRLH